MTFTSEGGIFSSMNDSNVQNEKNLQEELNRARKELSILYDVSTAMRTTLELNHVLYIILTGVTAHTGLGFNRALLFLVSKKERALEGRMAIGPESGEQAQKIWKHIETENHDLEDLIDTERIAQNIASPANQQIRQVKIPLNADDGGLLAKTYFSGTPLHIKGDTIEKYTHDPLLKIFKTNELVIIPLKVKDKVNGIIVADNLYTQKPITQDNLKIFIMLANQAGLAIENSQLYELVVHKSHTDSLTALWNHGYFQDTLLAEIKKAKETNQALSLLIIDVDDFKKFNDSWGHQNGDMALTELARVLKECSREIDYVCRYGGEEFSIILTNTPKQQAFMIAERLRQQIAQYQFPVASSKRRLQLTVSLGLASFPEDAGTKEELILKADKTMYLAKFIGKNKTCTVDTQET